MIASISKMNLAAQNTTGVAWWLWIILIIIFLVLVWFLISLFSRKETPPAKVEKMAETPKVSPPAPMAEKIADIPMTSAAPVASPAAANDLKIIEGIGPKIASLLQSAGITTFDQLAKTEVTRLQEILEAANLQHLANPGTWPQQATLAAAGKWDDLKVLQDLLKGGKKINP
jgi:large subunit ribosomal protein L20